MIRPSLRRRLAAVEERIKGEVVGDVVLAAIKESSPLFFANLHAASVVALVRYGEPRIDEPLLHAKLRASRRLFDRFGLDAIQRFEKGEPVQVPADVATQLVSVLGPAAKPLLAPADPREYRLHPLLKEEFGGQIFMLREQVFQDWSGAFASAPRWLLKFTGVARDADILGFRLSDLSRAPNLGRTARNDRDRWPFPPLGRIDAGGPCDETEWDTTTELLMNRNIWSGRRPYRPHHNELEPVRR